MTAEYTPNLQLRLSQDDEFIDHTVHFRPNFQAIDSAIGNLQDLTTDVKDNVIEAINEVDERAKNINLTIESIGDPNDLTTTNKTNLVAAISENKSRLDGHDQTLSELQSLSQAIIPVGVIQLFTGTTSPEGWLFCRGQAVSRTDYSKLFEVVGTSFGTGDGSLTFNLPDLRGRVPVGFDINQTEFNNINITGGEKTHTLTTNEMPAHTHQSPTFSGIAGTSYEVPNTQFNVYDYINAAPTSSTGGNQAHNNLQPYITLNYIIKI